MTVSELIAQLKTMPQHMQVKTYTETVLFDGIGSSGMPESITIQCEPCDAGEVLDVKNQAAYVLIVGA